MEAFVGISSDISVWSHSARIFVTFLIFHEKKIKISKFSQKIEKFAYFYLNYTTLWETAVNLDKNLQNISKIGNKNFHDTFNHSLHILKWAFWHAEQKNFIHKLLANILSNHEPHVRVVNLKLIEKSLRIISREMSE